MTKTVTMPMSQYMTQLAHADRMMSRMRQIAQDCGATLGEGAMYDCIEFRDPAQSREYFRRLREEMGV